VHLIAFHPTVNGEAHLVGNGEPKYSVNRKYRGALWKNYREGKGALRDKIILPSDSSILPAASRFGTENIIRSDLWSTGKKSTVLHVTFVDKNQLQYKFADAYYEPCWPCGVPFLRWCLHYDRLVAVKMTSFLCETLINAGDTRRVIETS